MVKYDGKFCLECKHFVLETATRDWSDMTPGSDAWMGCNKLHWELKLYEDSTASYRKKVRTAETCADFEAVSE